MSTGSLFGAGPQVLLDDASGRIEYRPDVLAPELARAWFEALQQGIARRQQRRVMYERELDVPRLVSSYALEDPRLPAPLAEAAELATREFGAAFNSVGLNLYRDRNDSVAPHNDRLGDLVPGHPIVLLSLGATRRMRIQHKLSKAKLELELEAGSLLLMDYATHLHYDHGIPKQRAAVGPRISLAFRMRTRKMPSEA
jgi:alkylated DNA repair dioxygenase AlkB